MFTIVSQGTFTQPATAVNQYIPLPSGADYFTTTNLTQMATTETTGVNVRGEWYGAGLTGAADGLSWVKTNSTNAINISTFATLGIAPWGSLSSTDTPATWLNQAAPSNPRLISSVSIRQVIDHTL